MDFRKDKVIGIVGGMGPHAGLALLNDIFSFTEADCDQEHLPAILMSFPGEIPDRTLFLDGTEAVNPAFGIAAVIKKLELAGANLIGIACNTAYAPEIHQVVLEELYKTGSTARILHMPIETCRFIKDNHNQVRRVGLMATNGTYRSGLYQRLLKEWDLEVILPEPEFQHDIIHRMIYDPEFGIKSRSGMITPEVSTLLDQAVTYFKNRRADAIILGCTELSLAVTVPSIKNMLVVDSTRSLAKALITHARQPQPLSL